MEEGPLRPLRMLGDLISESKELESFVKKLDNVLDCDKLYMIHPVEQASGSDCGAHALKNAFFLFLALCCESKEESLQHVKNLTNKDVYWKLFHEWNESLLKAAQEKQFPIPVVNAGCIEVSFAEHILSNCFPSLPQLKSCITFFNGDSN